MGKINCKIKLLYIFLLATILISCESEFEGGADGRVVVTTDAIDPTETIIDDITISISCGEVRLEGKSLPSDFRVLSKGLIFSTDSFDLKIKSHSFLGFEHYNNYYGCFQRYSYIPIFNNATVINIGIADTLWKDNGQVAGFSFWESGGYGVFACPLVNLQRGTRYYVRSFAHISNGLGSDAGTFNKYLYGNVREFVSAGIKEDPTVWVPIEALGICVMKQDAFSTNSSVNAYSGCSQINFGRSVGGFTNWRVPTIQELEEIYKLRNQIGGFKAAPYWSSTEVYSDDIWYYYWDFSTNTRVNPNLNDYGNKFPTGYVRLVRPLK